MPAAVAPNRELLPMRGGGSDHLHGHTDLTNCIHLQHHHAHGSSEWRRSPTRFSGLVSAALMQETSTRRLSAHGDRIESSIALSKAWTDLTAAAAR